MGILKQDKRGIAMFSLLLLVLLGPSGDHPPAINGNSTLLQSSRWELISILRVL